MKAEERAGQPSVITPLIFLISHVIKKNEKCNCPWFVVCKTSLSVALAGLRALVTVNVALIVIFVFLKMKFYNYFYTVQLSVFVGAEPDFFCKV